MQETKTTPEQKAEQMRAQPISFTTQTFSELELKNQKFKRIAWAAAVLLFAVLTVLMLQLAGMMTY
ncbi:MAG TPA: hypothetical protein VHF07_08030 [Nitrospiraceae bacterium]|nr:hypothetical protein [Nitrospiraceae bacterium]